jgi:tryptophanyl-tRNA synthetase
MVTDINRPRLSDPGHPEDCNVFHLMRCYINGNDIHAVKAGCESATLGCIRDCKPMLTEIINTTYVDARNKRHQLLSEKGILDDILRVGAKKARAVASVTLANFHEALGLDTLEILSG